MNKNIFICALTTLTLAACSSDDDAPSTPPAAERRLTVVVNETPFVSADGGEAKERMETRGSVITTSTLNSFDMNYGENRYTIEKVGLLAWNITNKLSSMLILMALTILPATTSPLQQRKMLAPPPTC